MTQPAICCKYCTSKTLVPWVIIERPQTFADGPMKMTYEAEIQSSRDFVWAIFNNPDMLRKWQPTLESFTLQAGEAGQPGAVSELVYEEKGKKVIMTISSVR